jgi:hypothetical protein
VGAVNGRKQTSNPIAAREVVMMNTAKLLNRLGQSGVGRAFRALLVAQQLCSFCQVPALKAVSALAGEPRMVYPAALPSAAGQESARSLLGKNGVSEKYHGGLHAEYCDGGPISAP